MQKSIAELWTVISFEIITYQLSIHHSSIKLVILNMTYTLYRKLSTKLLAETANENTKFMFTKTRRRVAFLSMISEVTVSKKSGFKK